eukprot:Clim_evm19s211 gene=Clim_evmTU19s211
MLPAVNGRDGSSHRRQLKPTGGISGRFTLRYLLLTVFLIVAYVWYYHSTDVTDGLPWASGGPLEWAGSRKSRNGTARITMLETVLQQEPQVPENNCGHVGAPITEINFGNLLLAEGSKLELYAFDHSERRVGLEHQWTLVQRAKGSPKGDAPPKCTGGQSSLLICEGFAAGSIWQVLATITNDLHRACTASMVVTVRPSDALIVPAESGKDVPSANAKRQDLLLVGAYINQPSRTTSMALDQYILKKVDEVRWFFVGSRPERGKIGVSPPSTLPIPVKKHSQLDSFNQAMDDELDEESGGLAEKVYFAGLDRGIYIVRCYVRTKKSGNWLFMDTLVTVKGAKMSMYAHEPGTFPVNEALQPIPFKKGSFLPKCHRGGSGGPGKGKPWSFDLDRLLGPVKGEFERKRLAKQRPNTDKDPSQVDHENVLIYLSFASSEYALLMRNLVCSWRAQGVKNLRVIAFDDDTYNSLKNFLSPHELYDGRSLFTPGEKTNYEYGQKEVWRRIMHVKTRFIAECINAGLDVMIMDADTALLAPIDTDLHQRSARCDIQFQADAGRGIEEADLWANVATNAGVYFALSNHRTRRLYHAWLDAYECDEARREQLALQIAYHNLIRGQWILHNPDIRPLTLRGEEAEYVIKLCYLPFDIYPNGNFFLFQEDFRKVYGGTVQPKLLHANKVNQDIKVKRDYLQQYGGYFLDPTNDHRCAPTHGRAP